MKIVNEIKKKIVDSVDEKMKDTLLMIEKEVWIFVKNINKNIYEIGRQLAKADSILIHGQFMDWITETFGRQLPYSTAALYKKIYNVFGDKPEMYEYPISVLRYLIQRDYPEKAKTMLEYHCEEMAGLISAKEHKKAYSDLKKGLKTPEEFVDDLKSDLDVDSLNRKDKKEKRPDDKYKEEVEYGFSRIDKGINLIKMKSHHGDILPDVEFRNYYIDGCDERIESLQMLKAEFCSKYGNPSNLQLVANL